MIKYKWILSKSLLKFDIPQDMLKLEKIPSIKISLKLGHKIKSLSSMEEKKREEKLCLW